MHLLFSLAVLKKLELSQEGAVAEACVFLGKLLLTL